MPWAGILQAFGLKSNTAEALVEKTTDVDRRTQRTRKLIMRLASKHLGGADPTVAAALNAIEDLDRLERMADRSFEAASWTDLLATP